MPKTMFEKIWDAHVVIEDLRMAAHYVQGKHVAPSIQAMMVPGLTQVRRIAEEEGIADIFREAGFDWRESGWSMRIAMNGDQLSEGKRCASTSNRNFEGRQGCGTYTPCQPCYGCHRGYCRAFRGCTGRDDAYCRWRLMVFTLHRNAPS